MWWQNELIYADHIEQIVHSMLFMLLYHYKSDTNFSGNVTKLSKCYQAPFVYFNSSYTVNLTPKLKLYTSSHVSYYLQTCDLGSASVLHPHETDSWVNHIRKPASSRASRLLERMGAKAVNLWGGNNGGLCFSGNVSRGLPSGPEFDTSSQAILQYNL